ncbi:hypothetical protein BWD07_09065 [Neisseria canis]|nr:hypothetical protein BWD07_09065 [Neisseria canis]
MLGSSPSMTKNIIKISLFAIQAFVLNILGFGNLCYNGLPAGAAERSEGFGGTRPLPERSD